MRAERRTTNTLIQALARGFAVRRSVDHENRHNSGDGVGGISQTAGSECRLPPPLPGFAVAVHGIGVWGADRHFSGGSNERFPGPGPGGVSEGGAESAGIACLCGHARLRAEVAP